MKKIKYIFIALLLVFFSCTKEKTLFEMDVWWYGHWQNMDNSTFYFSIGQKPVGNNEVRTPQFFNSTSDSIYENYYMKELFDFDHKKRYKIIKTSEDTYIKIQEIEEEHIIRVYGPSNSLKALEASFKEYSRLPDSVAPPFPDSILFRD
jgi:hypothetical protein